MVSRPWPTPGTDKPTKGWADGRFNMLLEQRPTYQAAIKLQQVPDDSEEADLKGPEESRVVVHNEQREGIPKQEEDLFVGLPVLDRRARQLHEVGPPAQPPQIGFELGKRLDDGELVDPVKGPVWPLEEHKLSEREQLKGPAKSAAHPPRPFRHRTDLSQPSREERNDPIGLAKVVSADDNRFGCL